MKYYGIVDKIKKEHKSGIYGRIKPNKKELYNIENKLLNYDWTDVPIVILSNPYRKLAEYLVKKIYKFFKTVPISLKAGFKSNNKLLVIPNELLRNNYTLDNDFSYGLLDNFTLKEKILVFKTLMTSKGGASLNIFERNDMPSKLKHFGGVNGIFNEGLYIAHPKDGNLLIPLKNFNNLIQSLVLEETIRAYEALGAKNILIEDVTEIKNDGEVKMNKVKVDVNTDYKKEVLRLKRFGKGIFNTKRALNDKLFIYDIPAVMSTIDARINGNQILEEFTETINLNIGVDVSVLNLFEGNNNFSYQRKWHFKVEFYNKNDMK